MKTWVNPSLFPCQTLVHSLSTLVMGCSYNILKQKNIMTLRSAQNKRLFEADKTESTGLFIHYEENTAVLYVWTLFCIKDFYSLHPLIVLFFCLVGLILSFSFWRCKDVKV